MNRLAIVTVGKTHSGKSTFAKSLESLLANTVVVDQDNHALFINAHYRSLLPKEGPNKLKYAITQTILDYAVHQTDSHIVLCNSNLARNGRRKVLDYFQSKGLTTVLVYFDIPDNILQERVAESQRSKDIFRTATTFEEVLARQQKSELSSPESGEADYLFVVIRNELDVPIVISKIAEMMIPEELK